MASSACQNRALLFCPWRNPLHGFSAPPTHPSSLPNHRCYRGMIGGWAGRRGGLVDRAQKMRSIFWNRRTRITREGGAKNPKRGFCQELRTLTLPVVRPPAHWPAARPASSGISPGEDRRAPARRWRNRRSPSTLARPRSRTDADAARRRARIRQAAPPRRLAG